MSILYQDDLSADDRSRLRREALNLLDSAITTLECSRLFQAIAKRSNRLSVFQDTLYQAMQLCDDDPSITDSLLHRLQDEGHF